MPQPLNRVIPDGSFEPDSKVLDDKPEMAKLVAGIFSRWASIEQRLSLLLVRILGADAKPAIAMFSTLTAQHLQMGALEAAAEAALSPDEFDAFLSTLSVTNSVQTPRNHLAHWVWGKCDKLPDALLLGDPKGMKNADQKASLLLHWYDRDGLNLADYWNVSPIV
jgi:hypothetical protein